MVWSARPLLFAAIVYALDRKRALARAVEPGGQQRPPLGKCEDGHWWPSNALPLNYDVARRSTAHSLLLRLD